MNEVWRQVPSLPRIMASSEGRLMVIPYQGGVPNGGLRPYGGVPTFGQWDGNRFIYVEKGKSYKVARLVCEAFNGSPPKGKNVCMHLDENARNNRPENLKWGTQKENLNFKGFLEYCRNRTGVNSPTYKHRAMSEGVTT
jgi:hypothetical protein